MEGEGRERMFFVMEYNGDANTVKRQTQLVLFILSECDRYVSVYCYCFVWRDML